MTDALPFTTVCQLTGNFPGEYTETLRWKCESYEGHDGDCVPCDLDRRMYNHRLEMRAYFGAPKESHLDEEALLHVVRLAVSESDNRGVMWLLIRQYLSFRTYLGVACAAH